MTRALNSEIQQIISTIEQKLPTGWTKAYIGCFWNGQKDQFKMSIQTSDAAAQDSPESYLSLEPVCPKITQLREDCWAAGDNWKMAVFGLSNDGRINVFFGDDAEMDGWIEKAGL